MQTYLSEKISIWKLKPIFTICADDLYMLWACYCQNIEAVRVATAIAAPARVYAPEKEIRKVSGPV